ncbi:Protein LEG1-like protein [Sciurus carolinensis]|uniref:Protein LEG1-like protein n=1 Tax=Sciurus carolinensis TaxID=30640 RepID=A0AA41TCF2_SCICA|nr:Protein LEG1-like protein [Sciurus carolinensis]
MAFFPSWVCVLVGSFSFSLAGDLNFSRLYPPLWKESPGQFSDYTVENGIYIIDPWVFPERLGMYKILLNQTATYFEKFAPENEQNLLWGLPVQHGWQYSSDLNYFLCVLPFLAAVDSGILGISSDQVRLLPPPMDQKRFCYDVSGCLLSFPKAMNKWSDFYKYVVSPSSTFDDLLKYLWDAHIFTLTNTLNTFEDRYVYYSEKEVKFEKDWSVAVEYIGVARIPTTLIRVHESQKGLPPRILNKTDTVPEISDFTTLQNTVLLGLNVLSSVNKLTGRLADPSQRTDCGHKPDDLCVSVDSWWAGSFSLTAWKIAMKTQTLRKLLLELFDILLEISD